ncbi:MAG TPA: halocarboxylic acid dehydrogenase DehI family protein [Clostridia bacterium]|nr:halocarboxylic acid dehydrogenase DehI family protein [Clostridia bacterium]
MSWKKGNRLSMVRESEARGRVREIYDEFKHALGVPHVNVVIQVYAAFPTFLDLFWRTTKPVAETQGFFDFAERLRADAYTRIHNYFDVPDLCERTADMKFSTGAQQELAEVIELFQYNNPLLLLLAAAQMQSFDGPIGDANAVRKPARHPVFQNKPILIEEDQQPAPVRKICDEMKRAFGMPVVNTDYQALARWPDFLRTYWEVLKPTSESPLFQQCRYSIRESAFSLSRDLPGPIELTVAQLSEAGMDDDDLASLVRITELFVGGLSGLVLNIAIAKIGMEGGNLQQRGHGKRKPVPATSPTRAA